MTTTMHELAAVEPPRYCVNCAHIGRNGGGDPMKYKCFAPGNTEVSGTDLVTGESFKAYHRASCYDARLAHPQNACGPEGKWYAPAPPKFITRPSVPTHTARTAATDLLSQLDSMK